MHPTKRLPRTVFGAVLLGALLGGPLAHAVRAQAVPAPPEPISAPKVNAVIVPINGTQRVQMSTGRPIVTAANQKETVARVSAIPNVNNAVLILGLEPGITHITLTDADGKVDEFDVVVQFDVEYLRNLLKRTVPTANIEPIPGANNTIILTGTVAHAEDIDVILRTTASVVGGTGGGGGGGAGGGATASNRVINAMRVGGVHQVQLCVVVARVARNELRRFAFDFLISDRPTIFSSTIGGAVGPLDQVGVGSGTLPPFGGILAPVGSGNFTFGILPANGTWGFLSFLQALRTEGVAKVLAEPRLVTLSGREANFLSGGQQAVPTPGGLGVVGVDFQPFGTSLSFLPIVLGNGRIHLEVAPEVSALDAANGVNIQGTVVPGRVTQSVRTTVEMEPGQTLMIGGLIQRRTIAQSTKVPCLGDLPFFGTFFRNVNDEEIEEELVILVTPHLVDPMSCDQLPKYLPGQETRKPDDFELFLEGILEAPRGQRQIFEGYKYVPAWMNSPTADKFPCADPWGKGGHDGCCGGAGSSGLGGGCGAGGCANGSCGNGHTATNPAAPTTPVVDAPPPFPTPMQPQAPAAPAVVQPTGLQEASPPPAPPRFTGMNQKPMSLPAPMDNRR